jgi:hypothetical protein
MNRTVIPSSDRVRPPKGQVALSRYFVVLRPPRKDCSGIRRHSELMFRRTERLLRVFLYITTGTR